MTVAWTVDYLVVKKVGKKVVPMVVELVDH